MPNNVHTFKALIKHYESITLDEIKTTNKTIKGLFDGLLVAQKLTGFGFADTCTLCKVLRNDNRIIDNCKLCLYSSLPDNNYMACLRPKSLPTYNAIENAPTPSQLLKAFKARAKFMRTVLTELNYKQP